MELAYWREICHTCVFNLGSTYPSKNSHNRYGKSHRGERRVRGVFLYDLGGIGESFSPIPLHPYPVYQASPRPVSPGGEASAESNGRAKQPAPARLSHDSAATGTSPFEIGYLPFLNFILIFVNRYDILCRDNTRYMRLSRHRI